MVFTFCRPNITWIVTKLVVSIILCQYQFAQFTISLDIVYRMDIVFRVS